MLGGRAAEELVYDDVTTGAESTTSSRSRRIARQMVGRWGMSDAHRAGVGAAGPGSDEPLLFPGAGDGPSAAHA